MKTTTSLTDRIASILTPSPMTSVDVWDALRDPDVRMNDVVSELYAMCNEGLAYRRTRPLGQQSDLYSSVREPLRRVS